MTTSRISPLAGKPVPAELLIDQDKLQRDYYEIKPDISNPAQRVSFGTSGHRGVSSMGTFQEMHVAAITQAVCDVRRELGITGPIMVGMDTHLLSALAHRTALEVLAGNSVETWVAKDLAFTPTPAISHAILKFNSANSDVKADGIVITPSHNPPDNAGFKYNPPHGGPAESKVTDLIQARANTILADDNKEVRRATKGGSIRQVDFARMYIEDLERVIDMQSIRNSGVSIGVHPLGGAAVAYWEPIAEMYGLNLKVVDTVIDPQFGFMTIDHDGEVRMDCSSPYAMASLIGLKDNFDVAFGNDPDADRHGIVTPKGGLMNPNHYLAVAIDYLISSRLNWPKNSMIGKTIVSSSLIDDVVANRNKRLYEVPVGFKWYADGLYSGELCFGGEESAGASFNCFDGSPWSTDKDGLIMGLLAAEMLATTRTDAAAHLGKLREKFGIPAYQRIDLPTTFAIASSLKKITPEKIKAPQLGGSAITTVTTRAPGNNESVGGVVIRTEDGWVAIRPSGTEAKLKIYGESRKGEAALERLLDDAQQLLPSLV